ncbi:hypothetical protein Tco_1123242 [Tanacetum coccineum]|uniref:PH domain-containing protein n=1 Tax=Tanacetum coccineum TaxID=301880 RepID=A0ABQ5J5M7_9ASTR
MVLQTNRKEETLRWYECISAEINKVDLSEPEGLAISADRIVPSLWVESELDFDISVLVMASLNGGLEKKFYITEHDQRSVDLHTAVNIVDKKPLRDQESLWEDLQTRD